MVVKDEETAEILMDEKRSSVLVSSDLGTEMMKLKVNGVEESRDHSR